jgi:hypothetical protein
MELLCLASSVWLSHYSLLFIYSNYLFKLYTGALHWGMEFAGYGGHKGYRRLMLGAAPVIFAWPTLAFQPMTALLWQWVGFTALWGADAKVTGMGWSAYSFCFHISLN